MPSAMWRITLSQMPESPLSPVPTAQNRPRKRSALEARYLASTPMDLVRLVREGLPWGLFKGVMADMGLTDAMAAAILHIPLRTLTRHRGGRLDPREGERVLRLVRLRTRAEDVLGTAAKASLWLEAPNRALGGVSPISLLDTDIGTQAAEDVLTRVEYGVHG